MKWKFRRFTFLSYIYHILNIIIFLPKLFWHLTLLHVFLGVSLTVGTHLEGDNTNILFEPIYPHPKTFREAAKKFFS